MASQRWIVLEISKRRSLLGASPYPKHDYKFVYIERAILTLISKQVILQVLDARDPMGTRCTFLEKHIREEAPHKHLVLCMNKVDLVPTGVAVS